jgi:adenylate cyclase
LTVEGKHEESLVALQDADPNGVSAPLLRTINLVQLNKLEEARTELKKVLGMDPTFTQAKWRDMYFYSDPSISERQIADLAKAGLSEK